MSEQIDIAVDLGAVPPPLSEILSLRQLVDVAPAKLLGAKVVDGEVVVDARMGTSVKGLYAAGCVTPANCQIIIAAGQGAVAAQSINRDLFRESLATHTLRRVCDLAPNE